jgi:hypothetical protein
MFFNVAGRRPFGEFGRFAFYICHCFNSNTNYPKRQTQNDFGSGVRPQRRRRGIFVEPKPK